MVLRKRIEVWLAIIVKEVEEGGFAEAVVILIDDGCLVWLGAVVADGDGLAGEVTRGFIPMREILKGVVGADFAGVFVEEDFFVVDGRLEPLNATEIKAEAVDGAHV